MFCCYWRSSPTDSWYCVLLRTTLSTTLMTNKQNPLGYFSIIFLASAFCEVFATLVCMPFYINRRYVRAEPRRCTPDQRKRSTAQFQVLCGNLTKGARHVVRYATTTLPVRYPYSIPTLPQRYSYSTLRNSTLPLRYITLHYAPKSLFFSITFDQPAIVLTNRFPHNF